MESKQEKSFLGIGWSFPPTFNVESGDVEMTSKEEDIRQSIQIYFNTKLGERIMRQDFGCIIHERLFDRLDKSILDVLTFELTRSRYFSSVFLHSIVSFLLLIQFSLIFGSPLS